MDQTTADALVQAVRDVARAEILPRFRALGADDIDVKSHAEDLVTVADRAAEVALTDRVLNLIPDAAVVGEEAVADDPAILQRLHSDGTVVVIDPIDGTWNYAAGLAMFGVILAVRQGGRTVMGLLYDAILDDWQIAIEGQGAWLIRAHGSRTPLNTRATRSRETETGYLPVHMFEGAARRALSSASLDYGRTNSLRCSLHEYRMLASGKVDWVLSAQSKPWDHLAGQLIVTEAGGACGTLSGGPYDPTDGNTPLLAASSLVRLDTLRAELNGAIGT
ncbi:Inositol-1-monophosphatase [Rhodobacteraceae bacterium THAF1]|uniref:inositol monophosphatase family protein n=1 Tax=Palleronia sp. THAF1 TaxID=2587842 RepID=UPI000F3B5914|nr:inositol monophosphatase family protein [Palleronia sp. THAF1]QFU07686.1 Inositol-1-monophosphatase [Palleronia sp. THAF1]VDC23142.1 Inositol-1-monophosphatase [Rhodobacteraceae bacterium THAF1]